MWWLVILLSCLAILAHGQVKSPVGGIPYFDETKRWHNEFTEHWFHFFDIPEEEIRAAIIHWEQIGDDLKNTTNAAEGTYGNGGETHGDYLRWSEKSGFILLNVNKCNGGPMRITRGKVVVSQSSVGLVPEKVVGSSGQHGNHGSGATLQEFLIVSWRKADFLIQKGSIADFASYTAGLSPKNSGFYDEGRYFSKVLQGYNGSANELPKFPIGYETYVKQPFKASIVSIGKSYRRPKATEVDEGGKPVEENYDDLVTEVRINVGKSSGITAGVFMRFIAENDDYTVDGVVVKKIHNGYSIAEYTVDIPKKNCRKTDFESCESEPGRPMTIGQKLSTTGEW